MSRSLPVVVFLLLAAPKAIYSDCADLAPEEHVVAITECTYQTNECLYIRPGLHRDKCVEHLGTECDCENTLEYMPFYFAAGTCGSCVIATGSGSEPAIAGYSWYAQTTCWGSSCEDPDE